MFNFLRRLATPELHQQLSIRERAIQVFSDIEGLDDIQEMMLRALESPERAHMLLTGAPASAKSLFMLQVEQHIRSKVYFAEGAYIASSVWKMGTRDIHGVLDPTLPFGVWPAVNSTIEPLIYVASAPFSLILS